MLFLSNRDDITVKNYFLVCLVLLFISFFSFANNTQYDIYLLSQKAGQGDADAQFLLGSFYLSGDYGVRKDIDKGKYYLLVAAGKGDSDAKRFLAYQFYKEHEFYIFIRWLSYYSLDFIRE